MIMNQLDTEKSSWKLIKIIVVASVLERHDKYYPQIFLHECAYKLYKL